MLAPVGNAALQSFSGEAVGIRGERRCCVCPLTHRNAVALRAALPWLNPAPLGLRTSAGCGDRMGLATPGHIRAARAVGGDIGMIFAQQSIREMTRTVRTPDEVMDDATWGIFQEGWREGVGADADHLKTTADIDLVRSGRVHLLHDRPGRARRFCGGHRRRRQPSRRSTRRCRGPSSRRRARDLQAAYVGKRIDVEDRDLVAGRADCSSGRPSSTAGPLRTWPRSTGISFRSGRADAVELEVSVDETDTPTTHAEHLFIARELRRLGVRWVSLAPRYVGSFEKGVDYIGDLRDVRERLCGPRGHRPRLGPYKLSLHSGSDKFRIYGIAAEHAARAGAPEDGRHELPRSAARRRPRLTPRSSGRSWRFAIDRYETDKASYHVSARLAKVPRPETLRDADLPGLLEQFDARQVLHIAFGSVLTSPALKDRLFAGLAQNEETYYDALERHFIRHLSPLAGAA